MNRRYDRFSDRRTQRKRKSTPPELRVLGKHVRRVLNHMPVTHHGPDMYKRRYRKFETQTRIECCTNKTSRKAHTGVGVDEQTPDRTDLRFDTQAAFVHGEPPFGLRTRGIPAVEGGDLQYQGFEQCETQASCSLEVHTVVAQNVALVRGEHRSCTGLAAQCEAFQNLCIRSIRYDLRGGDRSQRRKGEPKHSPRSESRPRCSYNGHGVGTIAQTAVQWERTANTEPTGAPFEPCR